MRLAYNQTHRRTPARSRLALGVGAVAAGAVAASLAIALLGSGAGKTSDFVALSGSANVVTPGAGSADGYQFLTLDDSRDLTFNQLLGVNNEGVIAGYFGSGAKGHPNKGFLLRPPFSQGNINGENFPRSAQTQVTGLNDNGVTVGFWSTTNTASQTNDNFGFYSFRGRFHAVDFPTGDNAKPPVNQLLGVNDSGMAVGFYTNGGGSDRGYEFSIRTGRFSRVLVPGAPAGTAGPSLTAAAINNHGDVAGFYNKTSSLVDAFLRLSDGEFTTIAYPGASMTQAFGVNDLDEVVGTYTKGSGNSATTYGFTWRPGQGFHTVSDPHGVGSTTINGVNDEGDLAGFYTDSAGDTEGLLALP